MRSVLVTGGTVRLGAAIAARLRADGWRVLTSSHRTDAGADLVADLSVADGADGLFAAACARLGGRMPDALVNNAALYRGESAALRALNFDSPRRLTECMAARDEGVGTVVNVLDAQILTGAVEEPRESAYRASKADLLAETRAAAVRFADRLRVNAVAPGPVLAPTGVHELAGVTPLGRPTVAAVAQAVAFLLEAPMTSGCVIPVDGGQWLAREGACR